MDEVYFVMDQLKQYVNGGIVKCITRFNTIKLINHTVVENTNSRITINNKQYLRNKIYFCNFFKFVTSFICNIYGTFICLFRDKNG